jgi:hypothetical protein
MIARIATGEAEDALPDDGKDPAAKALGKARAASMTPARRTGIAKKKPPRKGRTTGLTMFIFSATI